MHGIINFPAKAHQAALLNDQTRHRCFVGHRRCGKTVTAVFACIQEALSCPRPFPRIAYLAPYLKQAKKLAWDYLSNTVAQAPRHFEIHRGELTVKFRPNNATISLLGADNIDAIRGQYFDFIVVDEMADIDPGLWDSVLVYCLADRMGRALIMGTPRGRMNKLYDFYELGRSGDDPDWSSHMVRVDQTDMVHPSELERLQRMVAKGLISKSLYLQEMECSFAAALIGAIYGDQMDQLQAADRYTTIEYDASLPVMTSWDLGYADATAVIHWQRRGNQLLVIGYDEFTLTSLTDIIATLKGKPWAVNYSEHYGPHDIAVTEYGSGNSRWEIAQRLGFEFEPSVNWSKEDGIESVRAMLPNVWITNKNGGQRLLECLVSYRYEFDDDRKAYKVTPLHDWTSHACDAVRMFAVAQDPARFLKEASTRGRRGRGSSGQLQWTF
jgi:phage terminase large subunit